MVGGRSRHDRKPRVSVQHYAKSSRVRDLGVGGDPRLGPREVPRSYWSNEAGRVSLLFLGELKNVERLIIKKSTMTLLRLIVF